MHAFRVLTALYVHRTIIPMLVMAAALSLSACAADRIDPGGRPVAGCRMNAVLYCDVDVHLGMSVEKCHCMRRSEIRGMLRNLAMR